MTIKSWTIIGVIVAAAVPVIVALIDSPSVQEINTVSNSGVNNGVMAARIEVVNPKPNPIIFDKKLKSINIPKDGRYQTEFLLTVGPVSLGDSVKFNMNIPTETNISTPIFQGGGVRITSDGLVPFQVYLISFLSGFEVKESDFSFSVENKVL